MCEYMLCLLECTRT
uniref:Uncharacterized protein n=1 Tax=Rhizophora mucronata TaxID=61149 RepID=A0A2P2NXD6_RHIMU